MLFGSPRFDTVGDLLNQITSFFGGIIDSPVVQLGIRAIAIYVVILWLAAAYWAFRDMQLRTANPILPYFAASLVILFTPVFFPFAIVAYRIVRPQEKIGEVYERTLAEEALLAEVEAVKSCPTCARRVNEEWIICPTCRARLNRVCPNCSRLVGLDWSLCAWCGRDFERAVPGMEAIAPPRPAAARPAQEPSFSRPAAAPAIETSAYRNPPPPPPDSYREQRDSGDMGNDYGRDAHGGQGGTRDLPAVTPRQPQVSMPSARQPQAPAQGPSARPGSAPTYVSGASYAGPPAVVPSPAPAGPPSPAGASSQALATTTPNPAAAYDHPSGTSRSLDRVPQPPTATRPTSTPARTARPATPSRSVKGAKGHASTDALPER